MNNISTSLSPPIEYYGVPPKLQKMNTVNSPILSPSYNNPLPEQEWRGQRKELAALHRRILQAETITMKFQEMKMQIEEIIRKEEENLKKHIDVDRETMEKLAVAFETSLWSVQEDPEAEVFVETEMSQIKRRMSLKLTNLLTENASTNHSSPEDSPILPQTQENGTQTHEELSLAEERVEIGLSQAMEEESNCHEQEEELSTKDVDSTLHGTSNQVLKDQILNIPKDDPGKPEQLLMFFAGKLDESTVILSPAFQYYTLSDNGILSTAVSTQEPAPEMVQPISSQEDGQADGKEPESLLDLSNAAVDPANMEDSTPEVLNGDYSPPSLQFIKENGDLTAEKPSQDLRIVVGNYYVLASDSRFFGIDWKTHYKRDSSGWLECNECSILKNTRIKMSDHVWTEHYGGRFHCPLCSNTRSFVTRHGVGAHMRCVHPNLLPSSQ